MDQQYTSAGFLARRQSHEAGGIGVEIKPQWSEGPGAQSAQRALQGPSRFGFANDGPSVGRVKGNGDGNLDIPSEEPHGRFSE